MRRALITGGALIAICAGYTVYWYSAATEIRAGIDSWAQDRRANGWAVELGEPTVTGFPFRLNLFLQAPVWQDREIFGGEMPNVKASARPWELTDIEMSVPGVHNLKTRGGGIVLTLASAEAGLNIRSGKPHKIFVRLTGWTGANPRR